MTSMPERRQVFDAAVSWLRGQLRPVVAELTGDRDAEVPPGQRTIAGWNDPPQFCSRVLLQASAGHGRVPWQGVARLLTDAGWTVNPAGPPWLKARHGDFDAGSDTPGGTCAAPPTPLHPAARPATRR
jgi:hypothetical protein